MQTRERKCTRHMDLLTLHGSLLVVFVSEGRNDPRWLRVHDDDDDDDDGPPNTTDASALQPCSVFVDSVIYILCYCRPIVSVCEASIDVREPATFLFLPRLFQLLLVLYSFVANKFDLI